MSERYIDTVWRIRTIMDRAEAWLNTLPPQSKISVRIIQQELYDPHVTYDQAALIMTAWHELGLLDRNDVLDPLCLMETSIFRSSVRSGLDYAFAHTYTERPRLILALPIGLSSSTHKALQREAGDLRGALIGMIASAQMHLFLASPFWDKATVDDLGDILARRLAGGIQIDLRAFRNPTKQISR